MYMCATIFICDLELFQQCGIFLFFIILLLIVSVNIEQCLSETQ